jgi:hypothetical protein
MCRNRRPEGREDGAYVSRTIKGITGAMLRLTPIPSRLSQTARPSRALSGAFLAPFLMDRRPIRFGVRAIGDRYVEIVCGSRRPGWLEDGAS